MFRVNIPPDWLEAFNDSVAEGRFKLPPGYTVQDIYLSCIGYDKARRLGYLPQYMRMMNKGDSGGYSKARVAQAVKDRVKDADSVALIRSALSKNTRRK